jgi:hypothetical protein
VRSISPVLVFATVVALTACGVTEPEDDSGSAASPVGAFDEDAWCDLAVPALFQAKQVGEAGDQASEEMLEVSRQASERWLALTPPAGVADDVAVLRGDDPQLEGLDELSAFQLREAAFDRVVDDVEQRCGFALDEL